MKTCLSFILIRFNIVYRALIAAAMLIASSGASASSGAAPATWQSKVDPWVLETAADGPTEFLVFLQQQADLSRATNLPTKTEKGFFVHERLTETARRTQTPLLDALQAMAENSQTNLEYRSFWVSNAIWVRGGADVVQALAQRSDVAHLYANPHVKLDQLVQTEHPSAPGQVEAVEWNIVKVSAPDVWNLGFTGQGVVIGGQDTGYDWTHPALKGKYRGWNGFSADHNYSWHDAIHANDPHTLDGNPCGFDSPLPCDDDDHGTHTMGTMVGDDGLFNKIGMAPGARWIGCRNMEQGWGTPASYMECFEWFIAPTELNGENPDPTLAPDVINNSWHCPPEEGCVDPNMLLTTVENVRLAGILTVQAAGNFGNECETITVPAIYDASFSVGATDSADNIASWSSRGPVTIDQSTLLKPDISAPGVSVRSSIPNGGYTWKSGTSMAAPHVAGMVALLLSARPDLKGQVDMIEDAIRLGAYPRTSNQSCGTIPGGQVPNNIYGWGRIDAWNSLAKLMELQLELSKTVSDQLYDPGQVLTYTLKVDFLFGFEALNHVLITDVIPAETIFITATLPHTQTGDTILWAFPTLEPLQSHEVNLVVQVPPSANTPIINQVYAASSDEFKAVFGPPIFAYRAKYFYLPWLAR